MFWKGFATLLFIFTCCSTALLAQLSQLYAPDQLIVKFLPEEGERSIVNKEDYDIDKIIPLTPDPDNGTMLMTFVPPVDIRQTKIALERTEKFEFVEYNFIGFGGGCASGIPVIPNDTYFERQWGFMNAGTFFLTDAKVDADIDIENAWEIETGSEKTVVAILDSGIKLDHPEFQGRIWENPDENLSSTDSDGNTKVDDTNGWDFANKDRLPLDDSGHGTNVAGIIAANGDNGVGYAGMDWHCKIMPLKVLNHDNEGLYSWWIEAIYYAVEEGADVINISVGGQSYSKALREAIGYAIAHNVTVIASMMNTGTGARWYPASFQEVIAVGAVDPDDTRSDPFFYDSNTGSNFGEQIDLVAPGNYIYGLSHLSDVDYNSYWGGTSQAAAFVTGLTSLLLAKNPNLTPVQVHQLLTETAEDQVGDPLEDTEGWDPFYGHGRINAFNALSQVTTSTSDLPSQTGIHLSPNPASGNQLFVTFEDGKDRIMRYQVMGMDGRIYMESRAELNGMTFGIPIKTLQPGNYLLMVQGESTRYIGHFVKAF